MPLLQFRSSGGKKYRVNLPEAMPGLVSSYLFSYHKSGSTLMDNMVRAYCQAEGVPVFSLFNAAFDAGVPTSEVTADALCCFADQGRVYSGFRHYPNFDLEFGGANVILLVRDPRDMLVSLYYSMVKSHVAPKGHKKFKANRVRAASMSIDRFVLSSAKGYLHHFRRYQQKLPADRVIIYRYEDVIYDKANWLTDLVTKLGLDPKPDLVESIAPQFDIFPDEEKQDEHIRQVHPGNYKTKLKPETIDKLTAQLQEFLDCYGYTQAAT